MEAFLESVNTKKDIGEMNEEERLRLNWTRSFLNLGGFEELFTLFQSSHQLLAGKNIDSMNTYEKMFIQQMLSILRIFLMAAFSASEPNVYNVISLGRQQSSVKEELKEEDEKKEVSADKGKVKKTVGTNYDAGNDEITQEALFGENTVTIMPSYIDKFKDGETPETKAESPQKPEPEKTDSKKKKEKPEEREATST